MVRFTHATQYFAFVKRSWAKLNHLDCVDLPLYARRTASSKRLDLFQGRHRGVAGERREQCPVRPAKVHGFLLRRAGQETIEEAEFERLLKEPLPSSQLEAAPAS